MGNVGEISDVAQSMGTWSLFTGAGPRIGQAETNELIKAEGSTGPPVLVDVGAELQARSAKSQILKKFATIDVSFDNAGIEQMVRLTRQLSDKKSPRLPQLRLDFMHAHAILQGALMEVSLHTSKASEGHANYSAGYSLRNLNHIRS